MGPQVRSFMRSSLAGLSKRRFVIVVCASLLVASLPAGALVSGCGGDTATRAYLVEANLILSDINNKAGELKKLWAMPLADQGNLSKALADYRKALGNAQAKLDSSHPTAKSIKLDNQLRTAVDKGRELADLYSPFADYYDRAAPLANQVTEVISTLEALQKTPDPASGLAGLAERSRGLDAQARSIVPPAVFNGMHQEFEQFIQGMVTSFDSASNQSASSQNTYDTEQGQDNGTITPGTQQQQRSRSRRTTTSVDSLTQDWARFNGQLSALMDSVRDVVGVKAKNAEVEGIIGQAVTEIQSLQKQFK
jgi:hypothetical protein